MVQPIFIACGIDVHKEQLTLCCVNANLTEKRWYEYANNGAAITEIITLLRELGVTKVGFESTSIYWMLLYDLLEPHFDVTLANPHQIKAIPGRKTDMRDAEWIATLLCKELIRKSYVPSADLRELRELCRFKASLVKEQSRYKNKQHKVLDQWNVNFTAHFSNSDTATCQYLLDGLSNGLSWDQLVLAAPTRRITKELAKKERCVANYFQREFSAIGRTQLITLRRLIACHLQEITAITLQIQQLVVQLHLEEEVERVDSIPGIGQDSAIAIVVEIGDIDRFDSDDQLVSAAGLAPSVYQSAGKNYTGHITKRGNRHLRRILHNCTTSIFKMPQTAFYRFYARLRKKKLPGVARVALMHKLLRVIFALLSKHEMYRPQPS